MKNKHLPQRTCIACRQIREKKALIRLVCAENGVVQVDMSGKKPGRGAYLCPNKVCWESVLKKNRLDHALRTKLSDHNRQMLCGYGYNLLEESQVWTTPNPD
ncbi:MAG: YlxR family protein [Dehalococcoidia bacterium]|nr:MAG: YlxR family protein [Dehalococcoidia bacterium]